MYLVGTKLLKKPRIIKPSPSLRSLHLYHTQSTTLYTSSLSKRTRLKGRNLINSCHYSPIPPLPHGMETLPKEEDIDISPRSLLSDYLLHAKGK